MPNQSTDPSPGVKKTSPQACISCRSPSKSGFAPFCSAKCQYVDLHYWLVEGSAVEDDSDDKK